MLVPDKRFASCTGVNLPRAMTELLRGSQFDLVSETKVKYVIMFHAVKFDEMEISMATSSQSRKRKCQDLPTRD